MTHLSQVFCIDAVMVYFKGVNFEKMLMKSFSFNVTLSMNSLSFESNALLNFKAYVPVAIEPKSVG